MDLILYHAQCPDGWLAAYVAKQKYPEAELIPLKHGLNETELDELFKMAEDKNVLMVDYSLRTYELNKKLAYTSKSFLLLDHHRTAEQELLKAIKELSGIQEIVLSSGKKAYIDKTDYDLVSQYSWSEAKHGGAIAYIGEGRKNPTYVYMHRLIMDAKEPTILVDHINRNTLDNRKNNLRFATKKQNAANMDRGSGRKGITRNGDKWIAQIAPDGESIYLGTFNTVDEAAQAYDVAAEKYFGEFARRNFVESPEPFPVTARIIFDMERSGAGLAWDYLFGKDSEKWNPADPIPFNGYRPWYINYTEDQDLWNWALPKSHEINAYLMTMPRTVEVWDLITKHDTEETAELGGIGVRRYIEYYTRCVVAEKQEGILNFLGRNYRTAVLNIPYAGVSEAGNALCKEGYEIGMAWFERGDGVIQFSLRSEGDIDVSAIAKANGGGGHQHAAGFQLSIDEGREFVDRVLGRALFLRTYVGRCIK